MNNYDDRIILDDDVEVEYQENSNNVEQQSGNSYSYSNRNVNTTNYFNMAFSKKYLALTLASLSIFMTVFMRFLVICGIKNPAFLGIWFFICASLCLTALIFNIINFAKNKKVDLNVSSIMSFISLLLLFLV